MSTPQWATPEIQKKWLEKPRWSLEQATLARFGWDPAATAAGGLSFKDTGVWPEPAMKKAHYQARLALHAGLLNGKRIKRVVENPRPAPDGSTMQVGGKWDIEWYMSPRDYLEWSEKKIPSPMPAVFRDYLRGEINLDQNTIPPDDGTLLASSGPDLNKYDVAILKVLASEDRRWFMHDISAALTGDNKLAPKTVGRRCRGMTEAGLVEYDPKNHKGAKIREHGRSFAR